MAQLSVTIQTRDRPALLRACLSSLSLQTMKDFEVVIYDDGRQTSLPVVEEFYTKLKTNYVRGQPACLSAARNICIKEAKGDYIAFIGDDASAPPSWAAQLMADFSSKKIFGIGGPDFPPHDANKVERAASLLGGRHGMPKTDAQTAFCIRGCNMAFKKTALLRAGLFDEKLKNGEDTDMALRVYRLGFALYFDPQLAVMHSQGSTLSGVAGQSYENGRSRIMLLAKFGFGEKAKTDILVMLLAAAFLLSIPAAIFYFAPAIFAVPALLALRAASASISLLASKQAKSGILPALFAVCLTHDLSFLAGFLAAAPAALFSACAPSP